MTLEIANDSLPPKRKPEDTAAGCRVLESDDRARAEESESAHMRVRLVSSADAWNARASLLERLEGNRSRTVDTAPPEAPADGENDNG
jgi:hypothetical protein